MVARASGGGAPQKTLQPTLFVAPPSPPLSYQVDTPRPSPRTNRTRRVPHPVLIGHAASLQPTLFVATDTPETEKEVRLARTTRPFQTCWAHRNRVLDTLRQCARHTATVLGALRPCAGHAAHVLSTLRVCCAAQVRRLLAEEAGRAGGTRVALVTDPPPSLPYKVDTSRPSLRTNWTRRVPLAGDRGRRRGGRAPAPQGHALARTHARPPPSPSY